MNKEKSLQLYEKGREGWNDWAEALLAEREELTANGQWQVDRNGNGINDETARWFAEANVDFSNQQFVGRADFSHFVFPARATFAPAGFHRDATFAETVFHGLVLFDRASFEAVTFKKAIFKGKASFDAVAFRRGANFTKAEFNAEATFGAARFGAVAQFSRAKFSANSSFDGTHFNGGASFTHAHFNRNARFNETQFHGEARFTQMRITGSAHFRSASFHNARFGAVTFLDAVSFEDASFTGVARFSSASFRGGARFDQTEFSCEAHFEGVKSVGKIRFDSAKFNRGARFDEAEFGDEVHFEESNFGGNAQFGGATFCGRARFRGATFSRVARFAKAEFRETAEFALSRFKSLATFDDVRFHEFVDFNATEAERAFSLAGASFFAVPDFIQAHFAEAPRLDNIRIKPPRARIVSFSDLKKRFTGEKDLAARWRALKRLATQGHDHLREQDFFKNELKARRWVDDSWTHSVLWFGYLYQALSSFGRSIVLPIFWWSLGLGSFAFLYFRAHLVRVEPSGLTCVAGPGEPRWAAIELSLRKGLLFLGLGSSEKINQLYACLYGIYPLADTAPGVLPSSFTPVIPTDVSILGLAQQVISAVLIFLFLLAIRNHFRIK